MPAPKGLELGVRSPFSLRVGIDVARFRGMNRQADPSAIGDDQFYNIENARLDGQAIRPRPGLERAFGSASAGAIFGIWDDRNNLSATASATFVWSGSSVVSP